VLHVAFILALLTAPATLTPRSDALRTAFRMPVVTVVDPEESQSMPMRLLRAWKYTGSASLSSSPRGPYSSTMSSVTTAASLVILLSSQAGTEPVWSGSSATPTRISNTCWEIKDLNLSVVLRGVSWTTVLVAFTVGLLAGTVTGFTGASGVVVVVPLLSLLCGLTVHSAIAASLFVDTLASLTVAYTYFRNGRVEVKDGVMIGLSSIAGAQIGAFIASATPESRISRAFGVFTIALGIMMMRRSRGKGLLSKDFSGIISRLSPTQRVLATVILGFGVGVITGVFGAGGGLMFLLLLVVVLGEPLHKAVGTSTLIMALTAFSGTVRYLVHGFLDVLYSTATSVGSILAGAAASKVANRLPERTLSMVMGLVFLAIGALMILLRGGLS